MSQANSNSIKKTRIGFVGMPFAAMPYYSGPMSIHAILHELTQRLAKDYECHVVAGRRNRDASLEIPGVLYYRIESLGDKLLVTFWEELKAFIQGDNRHVMDREVYTPFFAIKAAKILAERKCEIVFLNQFPQWLSHFRRYLPKARLIVWLHSLHNIEGFEDVSKQLILADRIVCCSDPVRDRLRQIVPHLIDKIITIPNAMDEKIFYPPIENEEREFSIFHSGRLTPYKGTHLLVDAFTKLAERYPQLKLKITENFEWDGSISLYGWLQKMAGTFLGAPGLDRWRPMAMSIIIDAEHKKEIESLYKVDYKKELILRAGAYANRLEFCTAQSAMDVANLYRKSMVFVHPAIWHEAYGMGVVEAMACATPVVTSDCGGPPQLVKTCNGGIVVDTNAQSLADGIESIIKDSKAAREMGKTGASGALQYYTWDKSVKKLILLIESTLI